ncbi:hypothetical protein PFISCL1PPCAC_18988, partial [Pristionchus fissidentatus]
AVLLLSLFFTVSYAASLRECGEHQRYNAETNSCYMCPTDQVIENGKCVECKPGTHRDFKTKTCMPNENCPAIV